MAWGALAFIQLPVGQGVYLSLNSWHILGYVIPNHAASYCWPAALLPRAFLTWYDLVHLCYFRVAESILEEGEVILQGFDLGLQYYGIGVSDGLVDGLFG